MSWQWFIGKKQVFDELMVAKNNGLTVCFTTVVRKNQDTWHAISKEGRVSHDDSKGSNGMKSAMAAYLR